MTYNDFGLPECDIMDCDTNAMDMTDNVEELRVADVKMKWSNDDQKAWVDSIIQAVNEIESGVPMKCRAYILDGSGGSGKTTVYKTLI